MDVPFRSLFDSDEANAAITALAAADHVTIVVGAGISMEAGLPSWGSLVAGLLERAVDQMGAPADVQEQLIEVLNDPSAPDSSAGLAHSWIEDDLERRVVEGLFGDRDPASIEPGPAARTIAQLVQALGPRCCEIATTNYDRLLRRALIQRGVRVPQVKELRSSKAVRPGVYAVRHLHGVVAGRRRIPGLVLTDQQYAMTQEQYRWQHKYVIDRLGSTVTLFVGMSMTDRNILRYLHRARSDAMRTHYAVLFDPPSPDRDRVNEWQRTAAERRWAKLGIVPLHATCAAEVSQFLKEVVAAKTHGDHYVSFRDRCRHVQDRTDFLCGEGNDIRLGIIQDGTQRFLSALLDQVRQHVAPTERLAIHVWLYRPDSDGLVLWGQSDRTWRDTTTLEDVPVTEGRRWVGVDTFQQGALVADTVHPDRGSRWNYVLSLPLTLTDAGGDLPLGVVSLASMTGESAVSALTPDDQAGLMRSIADMVETFIADVFDEPVTAR